MQNDSFLKWVLNLCGMLKNGRNSEVDKHKLLETTFHMNSICKHIF